MLRGKLTIWSCDGIDPYPKFRLRHNEQILRKKGRGRLIHVLDFITSEDG